MKICCRRWRLSETTAQTISKTGADSTTDAANAGQNQGGHNWGNDQPEPPHRTAFICKKCKNKIKKIRFGENLLFDVLQVATISAHWSFVVQLPPQNLDQASFTTFLVSSQKASAPLCSSSWSKCLDPADNCHCQEIEISCLMSTFTCVSIDDHSSNCYQQETRQQLNIQHFVKVSEIISPIMITSAGFWDHFIFINCYLVTLSILALLLIHCKLYSCIHTLSVTRITTNCFKLTKTD